LGLRPWAAPSKRSSRQRAI